MKPQIKSTLPHGHPATLRNRQQAQEDTGGEDVGQSGSQGQDIPTVVVDEVDLGVADVNADDTDENGPEQDPDNSTT